MKRTIALICSIALLICMFPLAIAAQSSQKTTLIPTNIPKTFPTVKVKANYTSVDFWHAMTGVNGTVVNKVVNWFNATQGDKKKIYVKAIFQGDYDSISIKIQASLQSKNIKSLPDLVQLSSGGSFVLRESPLVINMDDLMNTDSNFKIKDKLNKNAMWACSYKGKQLGMPFSNSVIVLHYNATAFKAAGLDPNSPPKTMAEFAQYAEKLVIKGPGSKPKRYGAINKPYQYHFSTWIPRQKNGTAFQFDMEDGRQGTPKSLVCATDGTLKATIAAWTKACSTGAISYMDNSSTNYYVGLGAMFTGSMVGYEACLNTQAGKKPEERFEPKMARLPSVNADDAIGTAIGGSAVYMMDKQDSAKKNATWEFVKFIASVDASAFWYTQSGYFPLNDDAQNTQHVQDILKARPEKKIPLQIRAESVKYYKFQEPSTPSQTVYNNLTADQMVLVIQGKITVDQAVANIQKKANATLKTWWDMNS